MKVAGTEELIGKLDSMGKLAEVSAAMEAAAHLVQAEAKLLCPTDNGELRNSIRTMTEEEEGIVRGICYTNKEYATFVEFGTGPIGEQKHAGISPEVTPVYTRGNATPKGGWWIPGEEIDDRVANKYHFIRFETADGEVFYLTRGQPAQPFLYPALKNNKDKALKKFREKLGGLGK